jgi:hypothetical protein
VDLLGIYLFKWAYENKFKLKTNNYGFKEIQNLIKFVKSGVAEVKLEMDVKITIRTTLEGNVTETTYVQQMPPQNTQHRSTTAPCSS